MKTSVGKRLLKTFGSVAIVLALLGSMIIPGVAFSKGHEAVVKSGTEFGVILNQTLSLPAANVR